MKTLDDKLHFPEVAVMFFRERNAAIIEWIVKGGVVNMVLMGRKDDAFYWVSFGVHVDMFQADPSMGYLLGLFDRASATVTQST